jgi:hypothetical protein
MLTLDVIRDLWWLGGVTIGAIAWMISVAIKVHDGKRRIAHLEHSDEKMREDICMLLRSQFATLDGLKQLKCNGPVSSMYDQMRMYVLTNHGIDGSCQTSDHK